MRQQGLTGYVLHQRPYQESRSLLYFFSKEFGVVHGIGKKNLPMFVPITVFATGKNALKTFSQSQLLTGYDALTGQGLFAGMYLNEILIKLLPVEEPLPALWQSYQACVVQLAQIFQAPDDNSLTLLKWQLRQFETRLFEQLGYGLDFTSDTLGQVIQPNQSYAYQLQQGFLPLISDDTADLMLTGAQLIDWQKLLQQTSEFEQDLKDKPEAVKLLLDKVGSIYRNVLDNLLNYQVLQSRELWRQFTQYQ